MRCERDPLGEPLASVQRCHLYFARNRTSPRSARGREEAVSERPLARTLPLGDRRDEVLGGGVGAPSILGDAPELGALPTPVPTSAIGARGD